jgi:hypothetical protein
LLQGQPNLYYKTGDSGNQRELAFCGRCGSHLYATSVDKPGPRLFGLRTGTLAEAEQLPPTLQVWCQSALAWAQDISDVESKPQQ